MVNKDVYILILEDKQPTQP